MVMPPPVAPARASPSPTWSGEWLPAADVPLDGERAATVSFDRDGRCLLTVALDRPAGEADVAALEEAADVLPQLHLGDLPGGDGYPARHAEAFGLPVPLRPGAFNAAAEVELLAHPGGRRLPARLGRYGLPARTGTLPAAPPPPPRPPNRGRLELALLDAGRRLVAATRTPGPTLCALALWAMVAVFVVAFVRATWTLHARFGTYGFDLGIYDQGTWLLSRPQAPLVTVRGLNLFGLHGSYILILVAPLYRLWADPRLLLLLQVVFLALPAVVVYRLGARHLGHPAAGLAVAVAYLAYPAMQWAITWQFHPEAIAAGLLALAALAADRGRNRTMALLLALAALCGQEVGLVVAGFGLLLVVSGRRAVGWRTAAAGFGWFLAATFVLAPLASGRPTRLFETTYGIAGSGPAALLRALPTIAGHALQTGLANDGLAYLLLVLLPLLGLPLLAPRWLLPVAPPLLLNLAAVQPEHHQIRYHYLATAAPLLAAGAVAGLAVVRARRRRLFVPVVVLLVLVACVMDWRYGPAPWSRDPVAIAAAPIDQARRQALALVDPRAPVSAQFNLLPHLAHRTEIYEFPNPFRAVNWGLPGDQHPQGVVDRLRFVVVQRDLLGDDDRALLDRLQTDPAWRTAFDQQGVLVLERQGAGG
ncbi:MAG TPA: DUF2079 domain-containing protein [Actinomycetota bacterium]|nr:DUF2079 domain-containing protein [Actinomycetota bacterium]